jgi:hypothetical protein
MKLLKISFLFLSMAFASKLNAQQIKDGQTVDLNGVAVTFTITNKETIDIKGQSFDRYKVVASAKNNSGKSFNLRLTTYPDLSSLGRNKIAELNCLNATGARLTSKKLDLNMKAQIINVNYPTKDKDGKYITAILPVTGSYYFDAGQVIENDGIFIVPKGEIPNVSVRSLLGN